ncbi:cytochrome P450 71B26-like [Mercurialis annua]|uniref:cytochrome P450 71B26-like n=1 Tax=Mercurialis annua TaxID=3986 RepID=UPI00215FFD5B|nr:cytochrome P450 71B26-like [Mercurialis annua]
MDFFALPLWSSLLILIPLFLIFRSKKDAKKNLPPSPPKLPIIGNLHQLGSELHHLSYTKMSHKYGPVMLLNLGKLKTVVISSAEAAKEAFKVHDLACSSRPLLDGSGRLSYNYFDVAFAPYGEHWRNMRKLIILELFSLKRVQSFRPIREYETGVLMEKLTEAAATSTPVILTDMIFALIANVTMKMSFGFEYRGSDFDKAQFHEVVHGTEAILGSYAYSELIPVIGWLLDRIGGRHAKTEQVFRDLDKFFQHILDDHMKPGRERSHDDMIDVLLGIEKEQAAKGGQVEFTKVNIKGVLMNLFVGGVDTSAITLNWAMAELMKNPRVMKKAQDEVRKVVGNKGRVTESELSQLPYINMIIKETFRKHPPVPLLIPRETISDITLNGYKVPAKTMLQVNVWAIGRDPNNFKDPEEFYPERFEKSAIDYKGSHFELLPFGAGRRMCVGMHVGEMNIGTVLSNLVYGFDWKLPNGMSIEDLNMDEMDHVALTVTKKVPLQLVPVKWNP